MSKAVGRIIGWTVGVASLGILGFIAISLFEERRILNQHAEVQATVKVVQDRIATYHAAHGKFPNSDAELGHAVVWPRSLIRSLSVGKDGVVAITLPGSFSKLAGKTVVLVPELKGRQVSWRCGEGTLRNYLWAYCPDNTQNTGGRTK